MKQLNSNQIKHIDNFLEAIGVDFVDIRLEMIDHIASEIEEKVSDFDHFFQDQKLQSPYLKYLLSKQKSFNELYNKQLRTKFWTNFLIILKQLLEQVIDIKNILILTAFILPVYFLNIQYTKPITQILFLSTIGIYLYISLSNKRLEKKIGKLKITQSYIALLSIITYIYVFLPVTSINFNSENKYEPINMYFHFVFFCLSFLILKTYKKSEKKIKKNYSVLTN
ncbi:hypothetical protein [Tenacibaculum amylolyticum]|uniref:hypothetical protein n=1 Tax=Tenacibaculum amylolyticum TaxID=104269 RepID=UPI00389474C0